MSLQSQHVCLPSRALDQQMDRHPCSAHLQLASTYLCRPLRWAGACARLVVPLLFIPHRNIFCVMSLTGHVFEGVENRRLREHHRGNDFWRKFETVPENPKSVPGRLKMIAHPSSGPSFAVSAASPSSNPPQDHRERRFGTCTARSPSQEALRMLHPTDSTGILLLGQARQHCAQGAAVRDPPPPP